MERYEIKINNSVKKFIILTLVFWYVSTVCVGQPEIKNVSFSFQSEREVVIISYYLDLKSSKDISNVNVFMSRDGGATFQKLTNVTGDIGTISTSGNKQIVFDVFKEFGKEEISGNFQFKVEGEPSINILDIELVYVKGGTFTMGCTSEQGSDCYDNEKPSHKVTLSGYYIGKYEVTQKQWFDVMRSKPSYFKGDNLPVENVSWKDIVGTSGNYMELNGVKYYENGFIYKLNKEKGEKYRLPTEAEWEFAARGGINSNHFKYSGSNYVDEVAWYEGNSSKNIQEVGTKRPNELGIYDMSGNVWELCSNLTYLYTSNDQINPYGQSSSSNIVIRGSCWYNSVLDSRVSYRGACSPEYKGYDLGFRVVLHDETDQSHSIIDYFKMAVSELKNNNVVGALENLEKYIEINPNENKGYDLRGFTYLQIGDYEKALNDYAKLVQIKPDISSYFFRGYSYYGLNKYIEAIEDFTKVINFDKDETNAYFMRGLSKSYLNDRLGAISDYDEIIKREKTATPFNYKMSTVYNNKAYCLVELNKPVKALPFADKALELDKSEAYIWDTRGEIFYKLGEYENCIKDMDQAISINSESNNSFYIRGLAKLKIGKKDEGCQDLSKAGELGKSEAYQIILENCKK